LKSGRIILEPELGFTVSIATPPTVDVEIPVALRLQNDKF